VHQLAVLTYYLLPIFTFHTISTIILRNCSEWRKCNKVEGSIKYKILKNENIIGSEISVSAKYQGQYIKIKTGIYILYAS
jgi:hypothetical protein